MKKWALISVLLLSVFGCKKNTDDTPAPVGPPVITSIAPNPATPGSLITISGSNFGNTAGTARLRFGNTSVNVAAASWTDVRIIGVVPNNTGAVPLYGQNCSFRISTAASPSLQDSINIGISAPSGYTLITSLSSSSGTSGSSITLTGINFDGTTDFYFQPSGGSAVKIFPTGLTTTQAVYTIPNTFEPGSYTFGINNTSNAFGFIFYSLPFTIVANGAASTFTLPQNTAQQNSAFLITGTNLNNGNTTAVSLVAGAAVVPLTVLFASSTEVLVSVPNGTALGSYTLKLRSGNQTNASAPSFTIDNTSPVIFVLSPNPISTTGLLAISGAGYNINTANVNITLKQLGVTNPITYSAAATAGGGNSLVNFQLPNAATVPAGNYWVGLSYQGKMVYAINGLTVQ